MSEPDLTAEVRRTGAKAIEWIERHDEAIEAAYEAGATMNDIATDSPLQTSVEGVRRVLKRRDVEIRPRGWAGRVTRDFTD